MHAATPSLATRNLSSKIDTENLSNQPRDFRGTRTRYHGAHAMPRPTTVLVDLDDTLFDHTHSSLSGLKALQQRFDLLARFTVVALAKIHSDNLETMHALVLSGELSVDEARRARFRALAQDCGAPSLDADILSAVYREASLSARRAVPGALELLMALRARGPSHAKVAVVTNNLVAEQVEKLAHLGMTALVDVLVISEEAGVRKPEPAIFRLALERCGSAPEHAVMVGDSWGADVLGARAAGIRAVWLNRAGRPCPGPKQCTEITSLLPTDAVLDLLLGPVLAGAVDPFTGGRTAVCR
jgi:HAD superfamily hydrolase (TIGR01509 family)